MKKIVLTLVILVLAVVGLMAAFPEQTTQLLINAARSASGLEQKSAVVDGETWQYLEGGPQDAEVVLLLHGFGGDKDNWTRFARFLTQRYRVIAPDLPGFGESARHSDWDYSLPAQRDRLAGFVDALNLSPRHLAGNSMGGHLATLYTHHFAEQILSLGLFDNAGINAPEQSDMAIALANGKNPLILESSEDFDELLSMVAYKKPFIPWPAKGVLAQRAVDRAAFNRFIFKTYKGDRSSGLETVLEDIDKPVLILWGAEDRILDVSSVKVMQPLLPQAEVVIMQETGHIPMVERPEETSAIYLEFIEQH